jgi:hypothetical protein
MLPWDKPKGRTAHKMLRCHIGNGDLDEKELKSVKVFKHEMPRKYFKVKDVVVRLK